MHFLTFAYIRLLPPGRSLCSDSICLGCFVSAQPALAGAGENSNVCKKYFLFLEFYSYIMLFLPLCPSGFSPLPWGARCVSAQPALAGEKMAVCVINTIQGWTEQGQGGARPKINFSHITVSTVSKVKQCRQCQQYKQHVGRCYLHL